MNYESQPNTEKLIFTLVLAFMFVFAGLNMLSAHNVGSGSEAYARVVSADLGTRTYTFSCDMDPNNNYLRDFFVRLDSGDLNNPFPNEAESLDRAAGDDFTYTFETDGLYHVGCIIVNESNFSQLFRGDTHIDLRNSLWDPEIVPVSGNGLTVELESQHSGNGTSSWEVLDARTGEFTDLGTGETIQYTAPGHGIYDFVLHADGHDVGLPVEFFDSGDPYFPDDQGVPNGIETVWIRNGGENNQSNNNTNNESNSTGNETNQTNVFGINRIDTDGGLDTEFSCKPEGSSNDLVVDWNFGDGNSLQDVSNQQMHSYASGGDYYVQCDVWDNTNLEFTSIGGFFTIDDSGGSSGSGENETNSTNTNNETNQTGETAFYNLEGIPAICNGGDITVDTYDGGRHITCVNDQNSDTLQVNAWDKPGTSNAQYFEMYVGSKSGDSLEVCLADTCISSNGFAVSSNYPIYVNISNNGTGEGNETNSTENNSTNNETNQTNVFGINRIDTDGGLDTEFLCNPEGSSNDLVVDWNFGDGNSLQDVANQQQHSYQSSGDYYVQCDVWDNTNLEFTSIGGFFTIDDSGGSSGSGEMLADPVWLSQSGTTDVSPTYFHLELEQQNDLSLYSSTDWEILDSGNSVVWEFYGASVGSDQIHVHTPDGVFVNSLSGADQLDYSTTYAARARFMDIYGNYTGWSLREFTTAAEPVLNETSPTWTTVPGFTVEQFATGLDVPVMVKAAPQNLYLGMPDSQTPYLYVTELYGKIKVIYKDGSSSVYADNLLNFDPFGSITGGGQMGLIGLYVDETTGDLYAGMVYVDNADNDSIKNKIVKFTSSADGKTFTSQTTIIDDLPSSPSHQIQDITMHDGRLYAGIGDALTPSNAQEDNILAGKIISMNPDGSDARVYAKGFRNPFGHDWSASGTLYTTDNAPDVNDRLVKVSEGENYGWGMDDNFATFNAKRIADLNVSPVDVEFNYDSNFSSSLYGHLFVAVGGPIYQQGPTNGKEIWDFTLDGSGNVASQRHFVTYTGTGYGTPIGLEFQEGSLYFTDIYGEPGFIGLGETEGNIYRVVEGSGGTNTTQGDFRAGLSVIPWYPKDTGDGIEYIFECNGIDGSGNYLYDFDYGDGNHSINYEFNRFYKKYPYGDVDYNVSCVVKDQTTSEEATKSIVINPSDFIGGG